jgi:hypothetical protein
MMQTLEATLDESGHVHFTEPVQIKGLNRVLITLLDASNEGIPTSELSNGAAMRAFLASHRLPENAKLSAHEIDAQILAERNAWD